jgi:hypothetical protein
MNGGDRTENWEAGVHRTNQRKPHALFSQHRLISILLEGQRLVVSIHYSDKAQPATAISDLNCISKRTNRWSTHKVNGKLGVREGTNLLLSNEEIQTGGLLFCFLYFLLSCLSLHLFYGVLHHLFLIPLFPIFLSFVSSPFLALPLPPSFIT